MINHFHKLFEETNIATHYPVEMSEGVNHYDGTDLYPLFPSDSICDFYLY